LRTNDMDTLRITVVRIGHLKRPVDFGRILRWRSRLFDVTALLERDYAPNGDETWQTFSDDELELIEFDPKSAVTVAITEYGLEDNYFMRRLKSGVVVLSLREVGELLQQVNVPIENFLLRNLYAIGLLYHHQGRTLPASRIGIPKIIHDETRSCVFDMNGIRADIAYSCSGPTICNPCKVSLGEKALPQDVLKSVQRELRRIRRPLYFRMAEFVRRRPLLSLAIAFGGGLSLELVGNGAYDLMRITLGFAQ